MSLSFAPLFAVVVLMSVVSSTLQSPSCSNVNLRPHKILKRLRQNVLFVEKPSASLQSSLGISIPRRITRGVSARVPGTTKCPWTWGYDDNPDRVPRYMSKASCPDCEQYCRAVLYYHRGLVQRCDNTTGLTVWKWSLVELPVAYVYDP